MNDAPDVLSSEGAGTLVIRGSVLRIAGFGVGLLMSVGSAALLLRHLGVEDAGRYNTVVSLVAIVNGLTDGGMGNIAIREYTQLEGGRRTKMMRDLLGLRIVLTTVGVILAVGFGIVAGYAQAMVIGTAIGGAGLLLQVIAATLAVVLNAQLRYGIVSALDVVRNGANAIGIVALVAVGAGLLALLAVPLPASAVLVVATVPFVRRAISLRPAVDLPAWRAIVADALPYGMATAVGILYIYLTVIVLGFVASEREVGIFSAAFRVFIVVAGVSLLVVQSAFPVLARAARDDRARLGYAIQRLFEGNVVIGAFIGLCVSVGAPIAIAVIAGPKFTDSVGVLRVQGAALLMTFVAGVGSYSLLAMRRHAAVLVVNAIALVVSLALTLGLGATHGAQGAAIANLVGEAALAVGALVALARGPDAVRVQPGVARRVAVALVVAVLGAMLVPGGDLVRTVVAATLYALAVVLLRAVPEEVRLALFPSRR